jgi:hypothetical protein
VHLVHLAGAGEEGLPGVATAEEARWFERRLGALVPAHLAPRVSWRVLPAGEGGGIGGLAHALGAGLIVMGVRPRRWLERPSPGPSAVEVLHGSACPVWFVPAGRGRWGFAVPAQDTPAVA